MTAPLDAALAWLASHRGIQHGDADIHAAVIEAHIDRLVDRCDRAYTDAGAAMCRLDEFRAAARHALDRSGSMADLAAAIRPLIEDQP